MFACTLPVFPDPESKAKPPYAHHDQDPNPAHQLTSRPVSTCQHLLQFLLYPAAARMKYIKCS
ncbi:hypothetical protein E2C01_102246 [Portunus trituberculatus]|uniref:Uncharacterized protein n=1 Tax=Portunus trituberculatus TaxID=210409 RepID=A0A5B7K7N2_PORTR|nr:hypothetical protein [Portunus trituberculatus]